MDKNTKILIADDSSFMRKVLKGILEGEGFSDFIECENGKECLEAFRKETPGIVFLDVVMPEVDGLEVLRRIGGQAKIIMVSAVGQEKIINEAKELGASGYITKPFNWKEVADEAKKVLS